MNLPRSLQLAIGTAWLGSLAAHGQSQSLAFTGGVLLNPQVNFRNLGRFDASTAAGPATGAAVNRTYTDGFNRVDAGGNREGDTGNWGYLNASQISGDQMVMTAPGGATTVSLHDTGDFVNPSANLEYRGSLGSIGSSAWGLLIDVGYQSVGGRASGTFTTDYSVIEDRFALQGLTAADLPPAPYAGTPNTKSPRIGAEPSRTYRVTPGGRLLSGEWRLDADLIPVSGGLYWESQLVGRLNAIVSAGVFVAFVNADLRFTEHSTFAGRPTVTTQAGEGTNDVIYGGFAELGLDWALWENASLVIGARWQPAQDFNHSVAGREASVDFSTAVAIHAGFSLRF